MVDTQLDLDTSDSEVNEAVERMKKSRKEMSMMSGATPDPARISENKIKDIV